MIIGMPGYYKFIEMSYTGLIQKVQSKDNPFCTSSFKFDIKYKDMTCHWFAHSKMKSIGVDELFKRKGFNNESS